MSEYVIYSNGQLLFRLEYVCVFYITMIITTVTMWLVQGHLQEAVWGQELRFHNPLAMPRWSGFLASRAGWPFMAQLRDKKKGVPSGRYSVWWSPLELSHLNDCTWGPCLCRKGLTQQAWGDQTLHIPRKDLSSRLALGWLLVDEQPWALRPHNPSCLDSLC